MIEEEGSDDKQGHQEAEKVEGEGSGCGRRGLWLRLRLLRRKATAISKGSRKQRRLKGREGTEVAGECCGVESTKQKGRSRLRLAEEEGRGQRQSPTIGNDEEEQRVMAVGVAASCNLRLHGEEEEGGNEVRYGLSQGKRVAGGVVDATGHQLAATTRRWPRAGEGGGSGVNVRSA
ncbi:hypothetical protein BHE74_00051847 [Ensete ventricosum]|nr:hypothetical protein BHE74_00051847 [Ensete ventricosum]